MRSLAVLAAAALALVAGPVPAAQAQTPGPILFADDFTGPAGALPDQAKWEDHSTVTYNSSAAFGLIQPGNNETLDGQGNLRIPATPTAGSAIRTGAKFGFQYGTVSAWMKFPAQAGYWPAFWTLNSPPDGSTQLPVGELDAAEDYTTWNNVFHAQAHSWSGSSTGNYHSGDNRCPQPETADLSGRFNKFTAKIEPGRITYSFNDVPCGQAYVKDPAKLWAFGPDVTRPNWLILDLAVGGAGGQQTPASQPAELLVDRVEVRALPSAPIELGATYELTSTCDGDIVEVPAAQAGTEGAQIRTGTDVDGASQRWIVRTAATGFVELANVASGKTAKVSGTLSADGAPVVQSADFNALSAQWTLTDRGNDVYQVVNRYSGKALAVRDNSTAGGVELLQQPIDDTCGQRFTLTKI